MNAIFCKRGALLGSLLLAAAAAANAGSPDPSATHESVTVEVEYSDINLGTEAGAEQLYRRIVRAARSACGPQNARSAAMLTAYRGCLTQAVNGAVESIDSPRLTALNQRRGLRQASS